VILNPLQFQRYIQASAKRAELGVRYEDNVPPHTDGRNIVLPRLPAGANEEHYRDLLHYANHEVDHVLYTDFSQLEKSKCDAMRSFLGYIWNALEDVRIEWLGGKEYEGDRQNADTVHPRLMGQALNAIQEHMAKSAGDPKLKHIMDRVLSVAWLMNEAHSDLYASTAEVTPLIEKMLSKEAAEFVEKIQKGDYFDQLRGIKDIADPTDGTKATFELAKRIFEEVYGEDAKKELERLKQNKPQTMKMKGKPSPKKEDKEGGKGKGKGDKKDEKKSDGDGEGSDNADGESASKPAPKDSGSGGDGEPGDNPVEDQGGELGPEQSDGEEGDERTVEVNVKYQEFLPNSHEMKEGAKRSAPKAGMHIEYPDIDSGLAYVPATKDEYIVVDFPKKQGIDTEFGKPDQRYMDHYGTRVQAILKTSSSAFAARVRTRLQVRSRDRYEYGVKKGKLHGPNLHRVTMKDAHEMNQKVFKRRIINDTLDTAVIWLLDNSGSMGGPKIEHGIAAAVQFNEAIGNVIGLPIEIHSFSEGTKRDSSGYTCDPLMYVHRDFNTPRLAEDELIRRMSVAGMHMTGNPDGDAIVWSYDRLAMHRAKRKLLIVASDGSPASGRGGGIDRYTREVVKKIETETPIEIVGIGIMDSNVARIYKEHYVISTAGELEQALLALIDKKVR
jgi:cobaltochelatase CobT